MTTAELRSRYPGEASSHAHMMGRARDGKAVVHPAYRKFKPFILDVGPKPDPTFTFDRNDNNNPMYGPGLCAWRSPQDQARNRSTTNRLTDRYGRTMTLPEWAEETGTPAATMRKRLERDWLDHEVIHGRSKTPLAADPGLPVVRSHWPDVIRKPDIWDCAFGRFEAAAAPFRRATRPMMMAWFAESPLREEEAIHDRLHGTERDPDDGDLASPRLRWLRSAMFWARRGATADDLAFARFIRTSASIELRDLKESIAASSPEDVVKEDRERAELLRCLLTVTASVWTVLVRKLPPPTIPTASIRASPIMSPAERAAARLAAQRARDEAKAAAGLDVFRVRRIRHLALTAAQIDATSARETAMVVAREREEDRLADLQDQIARGAAARAKADALGLPRFEDRDAPLPDCLIFAPDPNDPDLIGWKPRPAPTADQEEDPEH